MEKKKINYSGWLKAKCGKSIKELLEEGKTLREIRKIGKEYNIHIPEKYLTYYRRWYLNEKEKNSHPLSNGNKGTENSLKGEEMNKDKLCEVLRKLIVLGENRINENQIDLSASDLLKCIELYIKLKEIDGDIQANIEKILGNEVEGNKDE